ncbi:MAG: hydroxymethylglutaryl-CoA synthase [Armatimonadetes bacterium]|nr:hydroxymethylglutaryl-CoA synthase [Armatimonadota bacterium]
MMAGITSYGAYIPLFRLGEGTAGWNARIEKAVASYDEDSITMAVAAGIDCLNGMERQMVDGLYLATTTVPYLEKQGAAIVAEALDLREDIFTADFANSLRAGTQALRAALDSVKAGSAKQVLVVAADMRLPQPRSEFEAVFGDGAAAIIVGRENVIAEIEESYSLSHEILDLWRAAGDPFVRSAEDRFASEEGYLKILPLAVKGLFEKCKLTPRDFTKAVFYAPDARRHREMARRLGFDLQTQVQEPLFNKAGNTGTAFSLLMLAAALEEAKPGDRILLAGYGDGADAFVLRVTEEIKNLGSRRGVRGHLKSKKILPDYLTYARWRALIDAAPPARRPPLDPPSPAAVYRERKQNVRLYGVKCKHCGYQQYPPQRVCTKCRTRDQFAPVRFSDQKATLFTYSLDYLGPTPDPPLVICFIDFEGGGRMQCIMTDRTIEEIKVGMPLEMSFRKLHTVGGIHNYYWKCMPTRG